VVLVVVLCVLLLLFLLLLLCVVVVELFIYLYILLVSRLTAPYCQSPVKISISKKKCLQFHIEVNILQNGLSCSGSRSRVPLRCSRSKMYVFHVHIFTHFSYEKRVHQTCVPYMCRSICDAAFFQLCDGFQYPGARPPEMRISSIGFNESHLRTCLDVARCSRAMISEGFTHMSRTRCSIIIC